MKSFTLYCIVVCMTGFLLSSCISRKPQKKTTETTSKEIFLPDTIWHVPPDNNFESDTSKYCYSRMRESDNFAIFWAKEFGADPIANPDSSQHFNPEELLKEGDRIYNYYTDELKFVQKGSSITDKYKALIFIIDGDGGTAFGGGEGDKVGIFWAPPSRMQKKPFGALAHELTHSFQYLLKADGATTFTAGHAIYEMTAQYCLWQVYPEWMTFENYHLVDFMKQTHYSFLHEINMYHSPYMLEYWSDKHGKEFIGKLWREVEDGEDAVMGYKRLTGIDQETFNDNIFKAAQKFMTWDMKRIQEVARPYRNQHSCKLDSIGDGWFRIAENRCPQNYGYNG
ncbi:MAG: hypothetical protein JW798_14335, partial [Prolixibacteraceae bacterium]|nr:hypothetical protein [Prolixibacteraceae bacterium]